MKRTIGRGLLALVLVCLSTVPAWAQSGSQIEVRGDVSLLGAVFPIGENVSELRGRVRLETTADPVAWLRLKFEATAEGLRADRGVAVDDVAVRVREAWAEVKAGSTEWRAGYGRLVWGRLDEIMPSDVLNPIDTAKYFLEGRAEARLPVAFVRGRAFFTDTTTLELLASIPGRRGRFDELDEPSSPFNLLRDVVLPAGASGQLRREEPATGWDTMQGGARLSSTFGRVDVSGAVYSGYGSFGTVSFEPSFLLVSVTPAVVGELVERYERFTMVAADAETVRGPWALRAEGAWVSSGRDAVDLGVGADRSAGDYRVFTSVVWHRDWTGDGTAAALAPNNDLSVIGSVERAFARERYRVRVFGVVNPVDESGFARALASWNVRDNLSAELSGGMFFGDGTGTDNLSRFTDRDFAFARLRWFF